MSRSLKVSPLYIALVKQAVRHQGFPSQKALAIELGLSRSTIQNFLNGRAIDYLNFVEIAEKLGLDWQLISQINENLPANTVEDNFSFYDTSWVVRNKLLGELSPNLLPKKYVENFTERHGILKVLGMQKPVSLDSVYTTVQLLNPEALRTFASIEALESGFRENKVRGFQERECPKQPGIEVANREQYLMVLGAPGMGKTTFLRKVGLEALKCNKGDYQPNSIPVLLELKTFRKGKIDFKKAIASEFANCGLPEYQQLTDKFLEQGKLLILLDGLDEAPTERMSEIVTKIQDFVEFNKNNRFIISCRIAAYRHNFRRFTDVAISDFDDQQIENFITNWFVSNPERGQECLARLNSGDYQAAKELTQTPLLLTLVCILYQRSGQFPTNRSTLYERALRVLLEEWNGAKEIPIEQLYKGLDTKRKELILSQIAYDTFSKDQLFFPKRTVVKQIEQLLPELLPDEKFVDGNLVLRDIEVQHGLLVERAESIYSFSHLTIQEFLTAQHIDYNNISIESLVNQHLCDQRWHDIFLSLAGLRKADNLLLAMEKKIYSLTDTPKLQDLLTWVEKVTDTSSESIQIIVKKAITLCNVYAYILTNANDYKLASVLSLPYVLCNTLNSLAYTKPRDHSLVYTGVLSYANAIANFNYYTVAYAYALEEANALAYANAMSNANNYALAYSLDKAILKFIDHTQSLEKYQIYQNVNYLQLILDLNKLTQQIPDQEESLQVHKDFGRQIIQTYFTAFDLSLDDVSSSKEELKLLDDYINANLLMLRCKQAAVRVSPEIWQGIESRMLLPSQN